MSRTEARERGLKRFFTGKPCSKGHVAERGVASRACMRCVCVNLEKYRDTPKGKLQQKTYTGRPEVRAALNESAKRRYRDNPELRAKVAERDAKRLKDPKVCARKNELRRVPKIRLKKAKRQATRMKEDAAYREKQLVIVDKIQRSKRQQAQAKRAAKILTETLGIPHIVVKMEDGTFQPVPESSSVRK